MHLFENGFIVVENREWCFRVFLSNISIAAQQEIEVNGRKQNSEEIVRPHEKIG